MEPTIYFSSPKFTVIDICCRPSGAKTAQNGNFAKYCNFGAPVPTSFEDCAQIWHASVYPRCTFFVWVCFDCYILSPRKAKTTAICN